MEMSVKIGKDAAAGIYEKMLHTMAEDLARKQAGGAEPAETKIAEVFKELLEGDPYLRLAVSDPETGLLKWLGGVQLTRFDLEQIQDFNEWLTEHYGDGKYSVGLMLNSKLKKVNRVAEISGTGVEKWRALLRKRPTATQPESDGGEASVADKVLEERVKVQEAELAKERDTRYRLEEENRRMKDASLEAKLTAMQAEQSRQMIELAAKFQTSIESLKASASSGGSTTNQIAEAIKAAVEAFKSHQPQDPAAMFTAAVNAVANFIPKPQVNALEGVVEVINTFAKVSEKLGLGPANAPVPVIAGQPGPVSWIRDLSDLFGNFHKAVSVAKETDTGKPPGAEGAKPTPKPTTETAATPQEGIAQAVSRLQEAMKTQPDPQWVVKTLNQIVEYAKQNNVTHPWLSALETQPEITLRMAVSAIPELAGAEGRNYTNRVVSWYLYSQGLGPDPLAPKPKPDTETPPEATTTE